MATLPSASDTISFVSPWHRKLTVCIVRTQSTQPRTVNVAKHSYAQVKRGMCSKAPFSGLWEGMCFAVLPHGAGMIHLCVVLGFTSHCPTGQQVSGGQTLCSRVWNTQGFAKCDSL